jgi:hypothetical protein
MDRERIVGTPEVIQAEPISNDSSESKLVGGRTASAICVVKKLVRAFQKACSVSSVEQSGFHKWQAHLLQRRGIPRAPVQASQRSVHFNVDESAITLDVSPV